MSQVLVTIDNRRYRLACNEGEEARLERLASMIDGKIAELRGSFGEIGDQRLIVMAALTFADSLTEAQREIEAERENSRAALTRGHAAAARIDALGVRLEALAGRLAGGGDN